MILQELQRRAVDGIKRHALTIAAGSPRAEAQVLQEYLWCEESAESDALRQTIGTAGPPAWVTKLLARQLADEERHAALLRERLAALGASADRPAPAIARAKLWWIERACAPYAGAFAAGPVVVLLAVAAQLEATGVRMFGRHLGVLEARERAADAAALDPAPDPTAEVVRAILADEKRHAKSCAAAIERLVTDEERGALAELRGRIAAIDRSFGVSIALGYWLLIAAHVLRDPRRTR
jgi:hypothetical protein